MEYIELVKKYCNKNNISLNLIPIWHITKINKIWKTLQYV